VFFFFFGGGGGGVHYDLFLFTAGDILKDCFRMFCFVLTSSTFVMHFIASMSLNAYTSSVII
jgi:hypothetical protein